MLLAKKGFHVLRFDYRGTGDSTGTLDNVTADAWLDDVGLAVQELRDTANLNKVTVIGLRLGALFAGLGACRRTDVDRLVVWDPVLSGESYASELVAAIRAEVASPYTADAGNRVGSDGSLAFNGFEMPAPFRASLSALNLLTTVTEQVGSILQIVSHETDEFSSLRRAWSNHPGYRYRYTAAPHDWNFVDDFGGILLPHAVIHAIVESLAAGDGQ
jgi:pimeloyl-ACP methyl ester carboxylesterase